MPRYTSIIRTLLTELCDVSLSPVFVLMRDGAYERFGVFDGAWCRRLSLCRVIKLGFSVFCIGYSVVGFVPASARELDCTEILVPLVEANAVKGRTGSRTIAAALAKLRALRAANPAARVCLTFRAGDYALTAPINIGRRETGDSNAVTILQKLDRGAVTLSGGVRLRSRRENAADLWTFDVGGVCNDVRQRSLFVDGRRRMRSRVPKSGFYVIAGETPRRLDHGMWVDGFHYGGDLDPKTLEMDDASEIVAFHYWSMSRLGIRDVDTVQQTVTVNGLTSHTDIWARFAKSEKYYLENVRRRGAKDPAPGEWFQDGTVIEYRPTTDELTRSNRRDPDVILPCTPRLLDISSGAHDVRVDGLRFVYSGESHTGYATTPAQAGIGPDTSAAIELRSAERIKFTNVEVSKTAGFGFLFDRGTREASIKNGIIHDLGAGAIAIGDPLSAYRKVAPVVNIDSGNEIKGNKIYDGGRIRQDAAAIWIGDVGGNRLIGNQIRNFGYTGISVGWSWGGMKISRNNVVENNKVENIGQGGLSDLGGIYTLSDLSGTIIRNNIINNISAAKYGGFGMYFDRESSGILAENNKIADVKSAGIALHYSYNNVIRHNSICVKGVPLILTIKPGKAVNTVVDNVCKHGP